MIDIQSASNPQFRLWLRLLQSARLMRREGVTLAEGPHLLDAALHAGVMPAGLIVRGRDLPGPEVIQLMDRVDASVPRWRLAASLFDQLSPVEHGSGLLSLLAIPDEPVLQPLAADMIYLDGVQDPSNVGAILRTAAAAGVRYVLCSEGTANPWSPKVLRAAMGAHFQLQVCLHVSVEQARQVLRGPWLVAQAHDAVDLWQLDLRKPALGWILGSEGAGPSPQAVAMATQAVTISCSGWVESLNVAAAAAVCLFERRRQLNTV